MKFKSVIQNTAKNDLREAVKWYNEQKQGLKPDNTCIGSPKINANHLKCYGSKLHFSIKNAEIAPRNNFKRLSLVKA